MRRLASGALLTILAASLVQAQAPDGMPAGDYQALESSLNEALSLKDNVDQRWSSSTGASGSIMTRPSFDRGDRIACQGAACNDLCRTYEYTYTHERMNGTSRFTGLRCFTNGRWRTEQVERHTAGPFPIVLQAPAPPPPDPAVVARVRAVQTALQQLAYYDGVIDGDFGPGSQSAARAFIADSGAQLSATDASPALLRELEAVIDRSNGTTQCELETTNRLISCGVR
jgi:hypothetical protein